MNSIEAKTIEDRAIVPLASFLHDCMSAIDPHYMETVVERFIRTKENRDKNDQLYRGVVDVFDNRGMRRSSLEEFDLLFLLQLFAFATMYVQKATPDNQWYPSFTSRYPFSKTVRNKIIVLRDKRNTTEHDRNERNRNNYLEILVSNFLDVFAHEIVVVIEQHPELFSERTKRENWEFVEYLKHIKQEPVQPPAVHSPAHQKPTKRNMMALALVLVISVIATVYFVTRPEPIPKKGFVFIACNGLEQLTTQQLVDEVSKQCDDEEVIAVDVVTGSGILWSKPVQSTCPDSLAQFIELVRERADVMTDITQFAASFDAGYLAMNKMHDYRLKPRMVMLGHLPEITQERNDQLKKTGWRPSMIEKFISTWTAREYASPLWIYRGQTHQVERAYVDSILIKSDSILRPEEHQL